MQIDWNKCVIIRLLANYFDVTTTAKLALVNFELYRYLPPLTNRTCSAFSFLFILLILHDMPLNCVLNPCGGWFAVLRLPLLTNDADVVCVCVPLNNHLNLLISSEMCDNNKHGTCVCSTHLIMLLLVWQQPTIDCNNAITLRMMYSWCILQIGKLFLLPGFLLTRNSATPSLRTIK